MFNYVKWIWEPAVSEPFKSSLKWYNVTWRSNKMYWFETLSKLRRIFNRHIIINHNTNSGAVNYIPIGNVYYWDSVDFIPWC